jgi:fatty-acyl-CoA synthase
VADRHERQPLDLTQELREHGSREALVIDGERVTHAALADRVDAMRGELDDLGISAGGRVGLLMPNSIDMVTTLLAAWASGAVVVPINTRYRSQELAYVVAHSEVELVLTCAPASPRAPDLAGRVLEAFPGLTAHRGSPIVLPEAPRLRGVLVANGSHLARLAPTSAMREPRNADGGQVGTAGSGELLLIYTSGTTANPKGCVHDVGAFLDTARLTAETMGVGEGDVVWDPLPFFHTGGLLPMLGALLRGATFCSAAHFDAEEALVLMERERVSAAYPAFSTLVTALLDSPSFASTDLSALRWILAIGPVRLLERVQEAIPSARQVSCYGCTEVGGVIVYNAAEDSAKDRATTSGRPFPGVEIEILDSLGEPIEDGTIGEIVVRAPGLLRRYFRDATDPIDEHGRFHTGDLGRIDRHGQLIFEGRLKDMLKVGGENVAASEIEFVLTQHPAVTLAAVVPMADDRLVEVPVAFVELKPDHTAAESDIIEFCGSRLASFKVPRRVWFVTSWPMSATKIQKHRLRDVVEEQSGEEANRMPGESRTGGKTGAR